MDICSNLIEDLKTIYTCAKVCTNIPAAPIADYLISSFNLTSTSIFYGEGELYKWQFFDGNFLLYDTGWGEKNDLITDFSNGSTFNDIYLGMNNNDIITLLHSMGFFIKKRTISVAHQVMDGNNKKSEIKIKYYFNEPN